eukprot:m.37817 g.37817  ORF g.37817 m.37817 type:complete len:180 (+) comp7740_c0_seq2:104-643(+)
MSEPRLNQDSLEPKRERQYSVTVDAPKASTLDDPFVLGLLRTISLVKEEAADLAFENERLSRRLRQYERRQSQPDGFDATSAAAAGDAGRASVASAKWASPREQRGTPRRMTLGAAPASVKAERSLSPRPFGSTPAPSPGSARRSRTMRLNSKRLKSRSVREIVSDVPDDTPTVLEVKF